MTTVTTTQPIPARVLLPIPPTATQVLLLQAIHGYPAVSLLMNTAPAAVMTTLDAATLRRLVRQATQRLRSETPPETPEVLLALDRLAAQAAAGPTSRALPCMPAPAARWSSTYPSRCRSAWLSTRRSQPETWCGAAPHPPPRRSCPHHPRSTPTRRPRRHTSTRTRQDLPAQQPEATDQRPVPPGHVRRRSHDLPETGRAGPDRPPAAAPRTRGDRRTRPRTGPLQGPDKDAPDRRHHPRQHRQPPAHRADPAHQAGDGDVPSWTPGRGTTTAGPLRRRGSGFRP